MSAEPGYSSDELERGEDQAWHIPLWGCLSFILIVTIIAVVVWYFLI
jgi:hypothetical protein